MRLKVTIMIAAFAVIATATAFANEHEDLAERIDGLATRYYELEQFNGSLLVSTGGELVLAKGYGMADFEWDIPNRPDTKFRLGSITKQFTAALVMQLVDEGTLSLDDPLSKLLPWYRTDTGDRVTLRQLLNHTSGIPSYTSGRFFREQSREARPLKELVTELCSGDLQFEPGSTFRYNNSGYVILGAVLEEATGTTYEQLLAERILQPLGMDDTGYDRSERIIPRRAAGYERTLDGVRNTPYLDMSLPHAAGAMYSTVEDLALWDRALYGTSVVEERVKEEMFTPGLEGYGFGWFIAEEPIGPEGAERLVIRHGGGINGFNTVIVRVPEDRVLIVLLGNMGSASLEAMRRGFLDLLYGREPAPPKASILPVLRRIATTDGADAAVAKYRELAAGDEYETGEGELNRLGYALLGDGATDGAIAIFRLNTELHPESANTWDSLGEGLAAAGETVEAIKSYARSLELDPGNRNAVERLAALVSE